MSNERTIDLIHRDLDGEATPAERSELRELLSSDAAARAEYDAMRDVVQKLDAIEHVDPPAGFKSGVMDKVRRAGIPKARVESYPPALRRQSFARVAYAAAAGVVLGIVISTLFLGQPSLRPLDATGAMTAADTWKLVAKERIAREGLNGSIEVKRNGERIAVLTRVNAAARQQIDIRWQPAVAPLEAVAREGGASLRAYDGGITIHAAGKAYVTAIVSEQEKAVTRVAITANGSQVLELTF